MNKREKHSTRQEQPRVAHLIVRISRALEAYEAGDPTAAIVALDGLHASALPDRPEWLANELEQRAASAQHGAPVPAAALDWVGLARDRLRRETGEDVLGAVTPVRLALRSALTCLGSGA